MIDEVVRSKPQGVAPDECLHAEIHGGCNSANRTIRQLVNPSMCDLGAHHIVSILEHDPRIASPCARLKDLDGGVALSKSVTHTFASPLLGDDDHGRIAEVTCTIARANLQRGVTRETLYLTGENSDADASS
eukprot:CAMPEP_0194538258 /NCGR_PEP_ID=MMETSP0253-20130528/77725_1 /TAXON_ID=2966 /ORGANISM="Noctiluca scintillans" /LENGTH=131 /DNA_ID=CAMNT_0039384347 /DNA_START=516 /DNA_END=908 /DNA_ORIENTATION=+